MAKSKAETPDRKRPPFGAIHRHWEPRIGFAYRF